MLSFLTLFRTRGAGGPGAGWHPRSVGKMHTADHG